MARRCHYSVTTLSEAAGGSRLPSLAVTVAYVEACGGDPDEWRERWRQVAAALEGSAAAPVISEREAAVSPPYRGLAAYGPEDARWFFGRDLLVTDLLDRLTTARFLGVVGASGSGKSSLLRAGLVPAVCAGKLAGSDGSSCLPVVMTPGERPLGELVAQLEQLAGVCRTAPSDNGIDPAVVRSLVGSVVAGRPHAELLLVVDQFEEVFALCQDDQERTAFVKTLLMLAGDDIDGVRTRVVIALRADFYAACAGDPDLVAVFRDRQVLVGPMSATELREAIVGPAEQPGLMVEGRLVSTVVAQVAGKPGGLPLASHALLEAWRRRRGNALTLAGYEAAGGVQGALAQTAEAVYQSFRPEQRPMVRHLVTRLVAVGDGVADTRRRVGRAELDQPGMTEVLDRLATARLVTLGQDTVEIAHEALIQAWPRLHRWLAEDRDGLRIHRQLTEATHAWEALNRDTGSLYRGARLAASKEWADRDVARAALTRAEQEFLDASIGWDDRERAATARRNRHLRLLAGALACLLAAATAIGVVAIGQRREAVAARQAAISRQLAVQALTLAASDPGTAMLLSVQAWRTEPTVEARSAVLSMSAHQAYRGELTGHDGAVSEVTFSRDGRTLISAGRDHTVRVWDVAQRRQLAAVTAHDTWLRAAVLSPDGRTLATGGDDHQVVLWSIAPHTPGGIAPGQPVPVGNLSGHSGAVKDIAFSPDGRLLATASVDGTVMLWDLNTGTRTATLGGWVGAANGVEFAPDGRALAVASADGAVTLWSVADRSRLGTLTGHAGPAMELAFSPDGRLLATAGGATTAIVWDVERRTRLATFVHGNPWGEVISVKFSRDGRTLSTAGSASAVMLWDVERKALRGRLVGHDPSIYTLDFSPRHGLLASAGEGGTIMLWDPSRAPVTTDGAAIHDLAFSPDGRALAAASGASITVWDAEQRRPRTVFTAQQVVTTVSFSPDGHTVATAPELIGQNGRLILHDLRNQHQVTLTGHRDRILDVAFSPDGRFAATGSADRGVILWDVARGSQVATLNGHSQAVNGVAFSPDGRTLASASHDKAVIVWDVDRRLPLATLTGHTGWIRAVAFSPDGRHVASADTDRTVLVWDVETRARVATLTDHEDAVYTGLAFSPDGRTLAYTSANNTIVLWDVARRAVHARLTGHTAPIRAVAFSPNGGSIASAGEDRRIVLWDIDVWRTAEGICHAIARNLSREQWRRFLPGEPYQKTCTLHQDHAPPIGN